MQVSEILQKTHKILKNYENKKYLLKKTPSEIPFLDSIGNKNWDLTIKYIEYYLEYSVNTKHPNFANRMWSNANTTSIIAELITAITNTSACTNESAPISTQFERYLLVKMLEIVGFNNGEGQMTTGSSNANMVAMMVARNNAIHNCKNKGLFAAQRLVAFVNEDAHYSFDKAVNILGIGIDNLIKIKTNTNGAIDINDLEAQILKHKKLDNIPFFVAATLGTTVRGAYDSIPDLVVLRKKYGFFLHGDGAWGGAAIMSDKFKAKFLPSIDELDSFTMDFHKMLNTSLICNFLLFNNNDNLIKTCTTGDVSYIFRENSDLGIKSLQCGRRVDSFKWFLDWQYYGKQGFAQKIERYYKLLSYAQTIVEKSDYLEVVSPQYSFNLCFRFIVKDSNLSNDFNQQLRDNLYDGEYVLLSLAYIKSSLVFRLLITNENVTKKSLDDLFSIVIKVGRELLLTQE